MLTYVVGAPGSGKTTVVPHLRSRLPTYAVIDWDAFMDAASQLADRDIRRSPETWSSYLNLVRAVVDSVPRPMVLLGVCTPAELHDWAIDAWVLLDCSDAELERRLDAHQSPTEIAHSLANARQYRELGLPAIDSTNRVPDEVASALADLVAGTAATA